MASSQPVMRLADINDAIRRRWRVVVASIVVLTAGVAGLVTAWPEQYSATAVVSVSPITPNPFGSGTTPQQVNMATEQQVVRSTDIATAAAEKLGGTMSTRALTEAVSVTSPSDSQILQISFDADTAGQAAEGANAVANAYLESRATSADALANRIAKALESRIDELVDQLDEDASAESLTDAAVQQQIIELRQQQSGLVTVALNPGRVIEGATPPSAPSSPSLYISVAAGLVAGTLLGFGLALLRDRADRRVAHAQRLREVLLGSPVIDGTREPDPAEPYRHVLLELTRAHPRDQTAGPVLVAIVSPAGQKVEDVAASLVEVAHGHRMRARLIDSGQMDMSAVDAGWPAKADIDADWSDDDLVVIDLTAVTSRTRRVAIALRCHAVVVAVTKRSRRQPVHDFVMQLAATERRVDLGMLLVDGHRRRTAGTFAAPAAGSGGASSPAGSPAESPEEATPAESAETATLDDGPAGWHATTGHRGADR